MIVKSMCEIYENKKLYEPIFCAVKVKPEQYPVFDKFDIRLTHLKNRWLVWGVDFLGNECTVGFFDIPFLLPTEEIAEKFCQILNRDCGYKNIKTGIK